MEVKKNTILNVLNLEAFLNKRGLIFFLFLFLVGIVIFTRLQIYFNISLNYIDSDQPFMWAGAVDYAKGIFHEPRFYGQNYNTFFEGLVAVPLIWFGLPVYKALPIATQFLFLFPFLFTASYLFKVGKQVNSFIVLGILLCLPSSYDIMSSLPRGFVTGIFFSSFFVLSFLNPDQFKFLVLNVTMLIVGYFINPNSLIVSVPFLIYLFQFYYSQLRFYKLMAAMLGLFALLYLVFDYFYIRHSLYNVYGYQHHFSFKYLFINFSHLDQTFAYLSFFKERQAWIVIVVFIVLTYYLFKINKRAFWAFLSFIVLLLFSFCFEKSRDGVEWPWYSYSRLYLCLPATLFLFCSLFQFRNKVTLIWIFVVATSFANYKIEGFTKTVERVVNPKLWTGVHLVKNESCLEAIHFYKDVCKKEGVDLLIISNGFWLNTFLNYGGPAIDNDFPKTIETRAERRYWVREALSNKQVKKFVFISAIYNFESFSNTNFSIKKLDNYGLYLIEDNQLTTKEFIDWANKIELSK